MFVEVKYSEYKVGLVSGGSSAHLKMVYILLSYFPRKWFCDLGVPQF